MAECRAITEDKRKELLAEIATEEAAAAATAANKRKSQQKRGTAHTAVKTDDDEEAAADDDDDAATTAAAMAHLHKKGFLQINVGQGQPWDGDNVDQLLRFGGCTITAPTRDADLEIQDQGVLCNDDEV